MSYNGSGTFVINSANQPVVMGTVITSTAFNALTADLATGLTTAITKDGQTTTTARILFAQGISSTLDTDATSATTGSIITAGGISTQKALWVGTTSRLVGAVTMNAALTYGGITLSNAVTGTGNMVLSASPTLTGTLTAAAGTFSGLVTAAAGTFSGLVTAAAGTFSGLVTAAAGVSSTLTTDATSATTGSIVTAGGISTQKALWVGTTSRLVGAVTMNAALTYGGVTLSNAVTGTGNMVLSASPTLTGTLTGAVANFTTLSDSIGDVRTIVQNTQSGAYVLVVTDSGKHISISTGGVTIPASVFSAGQAVTIYNNSGSSQAITQGSGATLRFAGTASTGNRTLAQYGVATLLCVGSNTFVISGGGLT